MAGTAFIGFTEVKQDDWICGYYWVFLPGFSKF